MGIAALKAFFRRSAAAALLCALLAPGVLAARTLTLRIPDEPETLDWNRAHTSIESLILMNVMEGLVSFDSRLEVVPALAQSWKVSDGGKTYTFKLRPGVVWSDGVPLRAGDFVYGWKRLLSPLTAAPYAYLLFDVVGAKNFNSGKSQDPSTLGFKALDDRTLQVHLITPVPHWLQLLTFWPVFPVRQDLVEKYGATWASPGSLVTLGPYQLVDHDLGRRYGFIAFPKYRGRRGNIQKFSIRVVKSNQDALQLYGQGQIDVLTGISTAESESLVKRKDFKTFPYLKTVYLGFSTKNYPFEFASVRRAIAMAINRAEIAKSLIGAVSATSFVPPPLGGYFKDVGLAFDPKRARKELASSGYTPGDQGLSLILPDWDEEGQVARILQAQLKKNLGLKLDVRKASNRTFHLLLDLHSSPFFAGTWSADYPDADNFLSIFLSDSGNNRCSWKDAKYDSLVTQARFEKSPSRQRALQLRAQKILLEDQAVVVPLFYQSNVGLVRARVHGFSVDPVGYVYLSQVNVDP